MIHTAAMEAQALHDHCADLCFHDLQPTSEWLLKRVWFLKRGSRDISFRANLPLQRAFVLRSGRICAAIDWQTLFTHNHTIISVSLREGLRRNSSAYHAGARCHKKYDCGMVFQAESCSVEALNMFSLSLWLARVIGPIWFIFTPPYIWN